MTTLVTALKVKFPRKDHTHVSSHTTLDHTHVQLQFLYFIGIKMQPSYDAVHGLLSDAFHGESLRHIASLLTSLHALVADTPCGGTELIPHFVATFVYAMKTLLDIRQKSIRHLSTVTSDADALYELDRVERSLSNTPGTALLSSFYVFACLPVEGSARAALYQRALDLAIKDGVCLPENCSAAAVVASLAIDGDTFRLNLSTLDPLTAVNVTAVVRYVWQLSRCPIVWDPHGAFYSWLQRNFDVVYFDYADLISHLEFFCVTLLRAGSMQSLVAIRNVPPVMDRAVVRAIREMKTRVVVMYRDAVETPTLHPGDMNDFIFMDTTLDDASGIRYITSKLGQTLFPAKFNFLQKMRAASSSSSSSSDAPVGGAPSSSSSSSSPCAFFVKN